ncbi:MAG: glycosyltransferase [Prolixibacteraceae bacterium]|nr:glycosyltransferase [Prolixibacteraceae bacterium]
MAILILGDSFTFPDGKAATNRVHTYAKGFYENDKSVYVISFGSSYDNLEKGTINGINFHHPFGQRKRSEYFIVRSWFKLTKYFKTVRLIRKINKNDKVEAILVYSMELSTHLFAWFLSGITKSILIKECGEHPLRLYQNSVFKKRQGLIKLYVESYLSDGILCISQFLIELYKNFGISENKLFLTPSTVDPSRFIRTSVDPPEYQYLGYFGGLTFKRDNVNLLIQAFSTINKKYPDVRLILGGFGSKEDNRQIQNLIQKLQIFSNVEVLNYLSRNEILSYITNARILVMVRGNDMESQASFPSKLTEYLCTSIPLVTVNVGEISNYLTDGLNAFIVEPENCDRLAEKLDYVLENYPLALEVATKGKKLTDTVFNYNFQAKRIIGFIESIKARR